MNTQTLYLATLCLSYIAASGVMAREPALSSDGTVKIAQGVYQRTEPDGSVTRMAYGAAGAQYDRNELKGRIAKLNSDAAIGAGPGDKEKTLAQLQEALAGIPSTKPFSPTPLAAQPGTLCGSFNYGLDSHFVVGIDGATTVARAIINPDAFGPPATYTSIYGYASATLSPSGYPSRTVTRSSTNGNPLTAMADWNIGYVSTPAPLGTSACTGLLPVPWTPS